MKNKIIILTFFATTIVAQNIKISELSAGDIISINDLKSIDTYGDIFNGNKNAQFIEVEDFTDVEQIRVESKICLLFKDLVSYYYPEVKIDDDFISQKIYNYTSRDNIFDIHPFYITKNSSYGILKVCKIVKRQKILNELLYEKDFPVAKSLVNYKLLLDRTAILRFKPKNQTYYISSIITGECLVQAYVNTVEFCDQIDQSKVEIKNFIKSSRFSSIVKVFNSHSDRVKQVNDYMRLIKMSLFHLTEPSIQKSFYQVFAPEPNIVKLNLGTLPDMPKERPSSLFFHEEFLKDIIPGDVVNVDDLKNIRSLITVDNFLVDVLDDYSSPFTYFSYDHCNPYNKEDAVQIEWAPYTMHPNHSSVYFYKFSVFDEVIKRRNYGVDPKYLNYKYKCLKIKICTGFERRKLIIPSVHVINLDRNDINKSSVFDSKNVVLRHKLGDETHYVARTEKGNCLFQALIYENLDGSSSTKEIKGPLLFRGKILLADDDEILEKWAEKYVSDFPTKSYKTLVELINNRIALEAIYTKLSHEASHNTMINIYLDKLN